MKELNIATLPFDDMKSAVELGKKLHAKGELTPDMMAMLLQSVMQPDKLRVELAKHGIGQVAKQ